MRKHSLDAVFQIARKLMSSVLQDRFIDAVKRPMGLFSFLKKSPAKDVLVAIGLMPNGVCIATVRQSPDESPVLENLAFSEASDPEARGQALKKLVAQHGLENCRCSVLLEPDVCTLLLTEAPDVPAAELAEAAKWRVKDLVDFDIADAVIDVFPIPGHKGGGDKGMLYVVAAPTEIVRQRIKMVEDAGLEIAYIDINEMALRNIAMLVPEDVSGTVVVTVNGENGLIVLVRQSTLYLARKFSTGIGAGIEMGGMSLDNQGVMDTLVVEVQRSLDYYDSHFALPPITNLVIAPMQHPLPELPAYLNEQLGINARELSLTNLLTCQQTANELVENGCLPLVGAALREQVEQLQDVV